jgi:SAM-dependent methyltransferase
VRGPGPVVPAPEPEPEPVRWEVRDKSGKVLDNVPARLTWPAGAEPTGEPNTFRLTRLGHQMFFVVVDPDAEPPLGSSGLVTVVEDVSGLEERDPDLDIPYVPTNMAVVDAMLEFAKVQADDIVYDLGCGDGRLFVTAAARHGAGAVGVDLDARRIADSRARAKEEGVTERVRFYHADLFQTDFPEASVLLMYLLPSVNRALRPRILRQMRPGSRVVSHDFDMGDWEPDGHREVIVRELDHHVFFWRVPAWVEGRWLGETEQAKRTFRVRLNLSQEYQKVSGTITWGDHTSEIDLARLTGTQFEFHASVPWSGTVDRVHVVGEVDGDTFTGTVARAADEARAVTAPITIRRIAAPATPSYALD